jgi:hypothetical protein
MKRFVTNFLTADSTFLTGAGTAFNLAGSYYRFNFSPTSTAADAKALFSDWAITGQDIKDAMTSFSQENEKQLTLPFVD